jgi:FPC/CPF motif-containing protein YcgG
MLRPPRALQAEVDLAFRRFVRDAGFPCVGAKAALARDQIKVVVCHALTSSWDDFRMQDELMNWAHAYAKRPELFRSLVFVFPQRGSFSEAQFERAMWERLQSIAEKDAWRGQSYDHSVSADPGNPHFSLSFGGQAFFVVGLHPRSSRPARRFRHPALVFNLHHQFTRLRETGQYEPMRRRILQRDEALAGSANPMLARHGEVSEARQYSGRAVSSEWRCPFHDPREASAK